MTSNTPSVPWMIPAGSLHPLEEFVWMGYRMRCERVARRTIFATIVTGTLKGARLQFKKTKAVALIPSTRRDRLAR